MDWQGYTPAFDDEHADELLSRGEKPVIVGPAFSMANVSEDPNRHQQFLQDAFQRLVDTQWNSPQRIFAINRSGQPVHFPWEDMVRHSMEYGDHASNDVDERWNPIPIPRDIEPMYSWEAGQGYIPNDLMQKYLQLEQHRYQEQVRRQALDQ